MSFAVKRIGDVVSSWSAKKDEQVGHYKGLGLAVSTYKATCRRNGGKTASAKSRDFNEQLLYPFLAKMSSTWEETFVNTIPNLLDEYESMFARFIRNFHNQAVSGPAWANTRIVNLRLLEQQLPDHRAAVCEVIQLAKNRIQSEQRGASELFRPEVQKEMEHVHEECTKQKGRLSASPIHSLTDTLTVSQVEALSIA